MALPIRRVVLIVGDQESTSSLVKWVQSQLEKHNFVTTVLRANEALELGKDAFEIQDAVISFVNYADTPKQSALIDAAIAAGVARFIPSEWGDDTRNEQVRKLVPVYEERRKITDYLKTKESSHFSWSALISGPMIDWALKSGFLGFDIRNHKATILDSGTVPFAMTKPSTVATVLVKLLSMPEFFASTANTYIYIASWICTQGELLDKLQKLTNEPWQTEKEHSQQLLSKHKSLYGEPLDKFAVVPLLNRVGDTPGSLGDISKIEGGLWNEKFGLDEDDLVESLAEVLEE